MKLWEKLHYTIDSDITFFHFKRAISEVEGIQFDLNAILAEHLQPLPANDLQQTKPKTHTRNLHLTHQPDGTYAEPKEIGHTPHRGKELSTEPADSESLTLHPINPTNRARATQALREAYANSSRALPNPWPINTYISLDKTFSPKK